MPANFMTEDFLLETETGRHLYHDYAKAMPIYDFHCHLPPGDIATNKQFKNLTQIWLAGDHYKWRAMRANGISEHLITGDSNDYEKFAAWAATVPKTIRNPLYHWTHLELKRPFGITDILLNSDTAGEIWDKCNTMLSDQDFRVHGIIKQMNVKVICTTDDPLDSLEHHAVMAVDNSFPVRVLPTFRPDRALDVKDPVSFNRWVGDLEKLTGSRLKDFADFVSALKERVKYFHRHGCRISDHSLTRVVFKESKKKDLNRIYKKIRHERRISPKEIQKFQTGLLIRLGRMYASNGWAMQLHIGAMRNNNSKMMRKLGPDTGYDSIADESIARPPSRLLDAMNSDDALPKTILYTLNPSYNEVIATMIGNFQDGCIPGKLQFGSGWWFNDQKEGMEKQINTLSSMGLLSRFIGMLTDSRSFLSYTRHEYFRRILCNLLGRDVDAGEIPADMDLLGKTVQDICWNNAAKYFDIDLA